MTRFRKLSDWLIDRHGERVHKVSLRGGFTCPNRDGTVGRDGCTYCAGQALGPLGFRPEQSLAEQLRAGIAYIRRRHGVRRFIAYFYDYSATYGPAARLSAQYETVLRSPEVVGIAVSTRPDCLPPPVLRLLEATALRRSLWVELGLQIANDRLLTGLRRGHTVHDFRSAVHACRARGLPVCAHVIVGLPGATAQDERHTAELLADVGIWGVKIHGFHVIRDTPLADRHAAGGVPVLSQDEYVERVVRLLEWLPPEVVIHRVTGEAPRHLTVAPAWSVNKLAVYDAVVAALEQRGTWQGRARAADEP